MKEPQELFCQDGLDKFETTARHIFECVDGSYRDDNKWSKLYRYAGKKLGRLSHFYYFICQPYIDNDDVRDELVLVGITSLIEAMMEYECGRQYKDFLSWYESEYRKTKEIFVDNFENIKTEYLKLYGLTNKIRDYFAKYILEEDRLLLLENIRVWNNNENDFILLKSIEEMAGLLYNMRSKFVHSARMVSLCPYGCHTACIPVDHNIYDMKITVKEYKKVFERSFVYF